MRLPFTGSQHPKGQGLKLQAHTSRLVTFRSLAQRDPGLSCTLCRMPSRRTSNRCRTRPCRPARTSLDAGTAGLSCDGEGRKRGGRRRKVDPPPPAFVGRRAADPETAPICDGGGAGAGPWIETGARTFTLFDFARSMGFFPHELCLNLHSNESRPSGCLNPYSLPVHATGHSS